jgi:GAF domain-containing protein
VWAGFVKNAEVNSVRIVAQADCTQDCLEQSNLIWSVASDPGVDPIGLALNTGQRVVCNNVQTYSGVASWCEEAIRRGYASSIILPLRQPGKVFGVLTIHAAETDAFNPNEIELLTELADNLSYGIQALDTSRRWRRSARAKAVCNSC